jgi:hypothetical protein
MMMPDFVLALALSLQEYGLNSIPQSRNEPMLDPTTVWRITPDLNVVAVSPPVRKVTREALAILNARRAGNWGKSTRVTPMHPSLQADAGRPAIRDQARSGKHPS